MPGEQINYPELSQEIHRHLYYTHHNTAAGGLTEEEALEQHWQEHHGPGGLRNHDDPANLHDWEGAALDGFLQRGQDSMQRTLDLAIDVEARLVELQQRVTQDAGDVLAEVDQALVQYPAGWAERRRPSFGDPDKVMGSFPKMSYQLWKQTLTRAEQWAHCGNAEHHLPHKHTVCFSGETPNPDVPCLGTPDFAREEPATPPGKQPTPPPVYPIPDTGGPRVAMALPTLDAQPDDGVERRRALRPGSQPLPVPQEGVPGSHDMVLADLRGILVRRQSALRASGQTKEAEAVRKLLKEIETDLLERRALGLRRYGSLLQPGNGRDPLRDAYEEVVDLVAYFKQLIMARDEAVTLLVELLNDRAVGEDPVVREKVGRVMYLLAGDTKKGSNDGSG